MCKPKALSEEDFEKPEYVGIDTNCGKEPVDKKNLIKKSNNEIEFIDGNGQQANKYYYNEEMNNTPPLDFFKSFNTASVGFKLPITFTSKIIL